MPWRAVAAYAVMACALAWLVQLPRWLAGEDMIGSDPTQFDLLTTLMMMTPAAAALIAVFAIQRPNRPVRELGLSFRPVGRVLLLLLVAWLLPAAISIGGAAIAGAIGALPADFSGQSMLVSTWGQLLPGAPPIALAAAAIGAALVLGVPAATLTTIGEELGWRGFLTPALRPLGRWRATAITALLWALWHAPIVLLGFNFGDRGIGGILLMLVFACAASPILTWLRIRSESVWPAAVAHGAINAFATLGIALFGDAAGQGAVTVLSTWPTWLVLFLVGVGFLAFDGKDPAPRRDRLEIDAA